jgi:trehalose-phosphatase
MEYLFENLDWVKEQVSKAGGKVIIFLDYDGTLTPIKLNPEEATLSPDMRKIIEELNKKIPVTIISGRSLEEIKEFVGVKGLIYAGNHGIEIDTGKEVFVYPQALENLQLLKGLSSKLKEGKIDGVRLEDKKFSISYHYRNVDKKDEKRAKDFFMGVVKLWTREKKLVIRKGKKVFEIRPGGWGKGDATNWIRKKVGTKFLPICIGDDLTDEDAFFEVNQNGGISICVTRRKRRSLAEFYLKSPDEVKRFLKVMEQNLPKKI